MGHLVTQFQGQILRDAANNRVRGHASVCGHAPPLPLRICWPHRRNVDDSSTHFDLLLEIRRSSGFRVADLLVRVFYAKTTADCSFACQNSSAVLARARKSSKLDVASCRRMSFGMHLRKMLSNSIHGLCEPSRASISSISCDGRLSPRLCRPMSSS